MNSIEVFKKRGLTQSWCQRSRGVTGKLYESGRLELSGVGFSSQLYQSALSVARALEVGGSHTVALSHIANVPSLAV